MLFTRLKFILLLFLFNTCFSAYGQQADLPIDEWIKALSVKKDIRSERYQRVFGEMYKLDSTEYCMALDHMRQEGPTTNTRYRIRLEMLQCNLRLQLKTCPGERSSIEVLMEALQSAYEIRDEPLIFHVHIALFTEYTNELNYGSAALHAMIAVEIAEKLGKENLYLSAGGWYGLGYVLFHSREYDASIKASKMALLLSKTPVASADDSLISFYKMNSLNTIGLCYEKLGKPDSAFLAFDEAMKYAVNDGNKFWQGIIRGNKGDVYYKMGRYDSAEVCLNFDYKTSVAASQYDNAANSLQWLALIELRKGNATSALAMLREATGYLQQIPNATYRANTLYAYTQVFSALGRADSMNIYMHKYLTLHDSIERVATNDRLEVVRMRMDNQTNAYKIISLSKEKERIAMIRNFIILFLFLLGITGFAIINRQKMKLKLRQQQVIEEKRHAEQIAEHAREQLDEYTRHLVEKTNLVETLQEKLINREMNADQMERISELSQHAILTEEDWEQFKSMFEKVYPGFFHELKQKSADITVAELRMAALCKLQIPAKEAANLLGISPNSVNKTRQRLRYRLGLDPDANLEQYFAIPQPS